MQNTVTKLTSESSLSAPSATVESVLQKLHSLASKSKLKRRCFPETVLWNRTVKWSEQASVRDWFKISLLNVWLHFISAKKKKETGFKKPDLFICIILVHWVSLDVTREKRGVSVLRCLQVPDVEFSALLSQNYPQSSCEKCLFCHKLFVKSVVL